MKFKKNTVSCFFALVVLLQVFSPLYIFSYNSSLNNDLNTEKPSRKTFYKGKADLNLSILLFAEIEEFTESQELKSLPYILVDIFNDFYIYFITNFTDDFQYNQRYGCLAIFLINRVLRI